jgi:hypothetical protein
MPERLNLRENKTIQNNLVAVILFLIGINLRLMYIYIHPDIEFLGYIADVLIISLSVGLLLGIYLQRKEDVILREVLGVSADNSLINAIRSMTKEVEYITERREANWKLVLSRGNKMKIRHEETHTIRTCKDYCDFYFRRGYEEKKIELKNILLKRNNKFRRIDYSRDFNQHMLRQQHGSYMYYTLTNLNFIKNLKYQIKIITLFKECMDISRDYMSIDFLSPTSFTHISIEFPFELKNREGNLIYNIDVKIRSLTRFHTYVDYKIKKSNNNRNNNILDIIYNKPLEKGDSIVIFYEKNEESTD